MRTGHTRMTHGHWNHEKPICDCGENQSVDHVLTCKNGEKIRKKLKIDKNDIFIGDNKENVIKMYKYLKIRNIVHEI